METIQDKLKRLEDYLHSKEMHPDYEYETTDGGRKCFDEHPPEGEGWQRNINVGRNGWERFDYHEEAYWMRLKPHNTQINSDRAARIWVDPTEYYDNDQDAN